MAKLSGAVLLLVGATQVSAEPALVAGSAWPLVVTALESNASWTQGHQPFRQEVWRKDAEGKPASCQKVTVLHDHALGWPGNCINLFQVKATSAASAEYLCKKECEDDSRCAVWQWTTQLTPAQCWIGFGTDCDKRQGQADSVTVAAAQRLQHGDVHVLKTITGVLINNLYNMGKYQEGTQELSIERCRDWCYSDIGCAYWQYSTTNGCYVDAPMWTKEKVTPQYPMTSSGLTVGTPEAESIIAGQFIQHECPRSLAPAPQVSNIFYDPQTSLDGQKSTDSHWYVWTMLAVVLLGAVVGGLYYRFGLPRQSTKRGDSMVARSAVNDEDQEQLMDGNFEADHRSPAKMNEMTRVSMTSDGPPSPPRGMSPPRGLHMEQHGQSSMTYHNTPAFQQVQHTQQLSQPAQTQHLHTGHQYSYPTAQTPAYAAQRPSYAPAPAYGQMPPAPTYGQLPATQIMQSPPQLLHQGAPYNYNQPSARLM
eukprot:CAMPEP_0115080148 /NCGR_PEP_ID=MMETSP0227-20121206/18516_1 /TAXON_ID=89957 /ORGANISM="Polarella glacialis, Strain CCMP 1383" /LENGTH=478 /DNA_ID=CAMNT_0002467757 /DNA_START=64 /DNA_END=1500 /DNA_ORIENTATION=+